MSDGLRDKIEEALLDFDSCSGASARIEDAVRAWLSSRQPSTEEIEAAAREYCLMSAGVLGARNEPLSWNATPQPLREMSLKVAERMLGAGWRGTCGAPQTAKEEKQ